MNRVVAWEARGGGSGGPPRGGGGKMVLRVPVAGSSCVGLGRVLHLQSPPPWRRVIGNSVEGQMAGSPSGDMGERGSPEWRSVQKAGPERTDQQGAGSLGRSMPASMPDAKCGNPRV